MFASLKSKIKEETGNDISKLTNSWRSGAFLGRITQKDESTTSPTSSGGQGDSTSESLSPQLDLYLSERTGGRVDHVGLQQQYATQLEDKLKERDSLWEQKFEQLRISLSSSQSEEAMAAQAVARTAQSEAVKASNERDAAEKHLNELKTRLSAAERAQEKLDAIMEELEESKRSWARERSELTSALNEAEARAIDLDHELILTRASLPPSLPEHQLPDDVKKQISASGFEDYDRVCRERAVLTRQLQETKMALQDVKTSWSGQIASLETQDRTLEMESRLNCILEENKDLTKALEQERALVVILEGRLEKVEKDADDKQAELSNLNSMLQEIQHDYCTLERKFEKEKREKDEALLRNAQISQSVEMSQSDVRYQETEITDLKAKILQLENLIAQHKENQATCMLIKENEEAKKNEINELKKRIDELTENENSLQKNVQDLETDISDKSKKIKTLDNRISDMKKTLQRELQSSKTDLSTAEEADISRRYLKHVVLKFLTARELEARQLTRALSTLLRLSAHEEALLRAAQPPRSGISSWLSSLHT